MSDTMDMDRYEKRAREIINGMNGRVRAGSLVAGTHEYKELEWLYQTLLKASKTYKRN